jgi:hypothetical protein
LRKLGVKRPVVEDVLDRAHTDGRETIDPHAVGHLDTPAERAALRFVLFTYVPTYASLMYVPHVWSDAGRSLKEWIVAQYAAAVDSEDARRREQALYSLQVDFFEVPERAVFVFPRLLKQVRRRGELLSASGPVPWACKRAAYEEAALMPSLHAGLAAGIAGSFFDVYGSVEPVEARALVRKIQVRDEQVRASLESVLTQPARWTLLAVTTVDQRDPRWTRWLHSGRPETTSYLVRLEAEGRMGPWVYGSQLVHQGREIGRLVHWGFPFDPEIPHRTFHPEHLRIVGEHAAGSVLFRVHGSAELAKSALGQAVESWPPGLFEP